ncbi:MAG: hypothetical protein ACRDKT_14940 [Actinomycetota bacterium]
MSEERTGRRAMSGGAAPDESLQTLYDSFPLPTFTWKARGDGELELIDFNAAAVQASQGEAPAFIGALATDVYVDRPDILGDLGAALDSKSSFSREMSYSHPTVGGPFDLRVTYVFVPPDMVVVHLEKLGTAPGP